jgi:putative endonuclease
MAINIDKGKEGEILARKYLEKDGYKIIDMNWIKDSAEIDLVAIKDEMLHFIEVKYRSSSRFGHPEQNVTRAKIRVLLRGIDHYLYMHPQYTDFRLDVLAITGRGLAEPEYFFIPDVSL